MIEPSLLSEHLYIRTKKENKAEARCRFPRRQLLVLGLVLGHVVLVGRRHQPPAGKLLQLCGDALLELPGGPVCVPRPGAGGADPRCGPRRPLQAGGDPGKADHLHAAVGGGGPQGGAGATAAAWGPL